MSDDDLKAHWQLWVSLPRLVGQERNIQQHEHRRGAWPHFSRIAPSGPRIRVFIALRTYAFEIGYEAYAEENYYEFRNRVTKDLVESLSKHDRHFPFRGSGDKWDGFGFSSDPLVWVTTEWSRFTMQAIVERHPAPIQVVAPALILFDSGAQLRPEAILARTL